MVGWNVACPKPVRSSNFYDKCLWSESYTACECLQVMLIYIHVVYECLISDVCSRDTHIVCYRLAQPNVRNQLLHET